MHALKISETSVPQSGHANFVHSGPISGLVFLQSLNLTPKVRNEHAIGLGLCHRLTVIQWEVFYTLIRIFFQTIGWNLQNLAKMIRGGRLSKVVSTVLVCCMYSGAKNFSINTFKKLL